MTDDPIPPAFLEKLAFIKTKAGDGALWPVGDSDTPENANRYARALGSHPELAGWMFAVKGSTIAARWCG